MIEDDCIIRQDKSFEGDGGCYNLAHVLKREKMVTHPFGMISADTAMGLPYSRRKMTMVF